MDVWGQLLGHGRRTSLALADADLHVVQIDGGLAAEERLVVVVQSAEAVFKILTHRKGVRVLEASHAKTDCLLVDHVLRVRVLRTDTEVSVVLHRLLVTHLRTDHLLVQVIWNSRLACKHTSQRLLTAHRHSKCHQSTSTIPANKHPMTLLIL